MQPTLEFDIAVYIHMLQGTSNSGPATQLSPVSSSMFSQSRNSYTAQNPGTTSIFGDSCEPTQNFSSPGSLEVTSDIYITDNGMDHLDKKALRQLEEQLSLNEDSFKEISPFCSEREISAAFSGPDDHEQPYDGYNGIKGNLDKLTLLRVNTFLFYLGVFKVNTCFISVKHLS